MNTVSRDYPLKHYNWGEGCDGWNLVDEYTLSVKQERMPPHTAEQLHFHRQARQFFFILKGEAVFEVGNVRGEGEDPGGLSYTARGETPDIE
jgi:mannose-6-phosphate isomerase-like protein (cupin superfamily)